MLSVCVIRGFVRLVVLVSRGRGGRLIYTVADMAKAKHNRQVGRWVSREDKAINFINKNEAVLMSKRYVLANKKEKKRLRSLKGVMPLEVYF